MTTDPTARERNPFLEAVGRVTVAGAALDHNLHNMLGMLSMEPTLIHLANAEGTARLIELCELVVSVHGFAAEDAADIRQCLARAKALKDKRNTVVHSLYMGAEDGNGLEALKPLRRKLGHTATPITVEEMEALADDIVQLRTDIFRATWNARAKEKGINRIPNPAAPTTGA
ncbi:hypothetical protein CP966_25315 [Streptomyces galilaeus]|uniref:hypothetical protein n=1 Tax=Streptomyces galilaeus TaxID=33899 RepID=UPI00123CE401|nr:hypothetical protein [Streptomyces galilaeus]QEU68196.1 hypothetical protein CP966_25315 [Streptomyces galilaeus]GGW47287.1 hypothetical protein GCM10010350_34240 [Streptomyces galilaeus]